MTRGSTAVRRAEAYYDSTESDAFYRNFWGGEDIHVGIYLSSKETVATASRRTVSTMASHLGTIGPGTRVLDLGAGYGGSARYLADRFGCNVTCLNLSETQNSLNNRLTREAGLKDKIRIIHGDFENVPEPDNSYDIVWSQDAILHSGDRGRVLDEVRRVLVGGGQFIFSDPMQADNCPDEVLHPVLERIQLSSLASFNFYRRELAARRFHEEGLVPLTDHLRTHYWRVGQELTNRYDEAVRLSGQTYVNNMIAGLQHWVGGADHGHLAWGILDFRLKR